MLLKLDHFPNFRRWKFQKIFELPPPRIPMILQYLYHNVCLYLRGNEATKRTIRASFRPYCFIPVGESQVVEERSIFQWKFLHGPFQLIRPTSSDRKIWCMGLTAQVEKLERGVWMWTSAPLCPRKTNQLWSLKRLAKRNCPFVFPPNCCCSCVLPKEEHQQTRVIWHFLQTLWRAKGEMCTPEITLAWFIPVVA